VAGRFDVATTKAAVRHGTTQQCEWWYDSVRRGESGGETTVAARDAEAKCTHAKSEVPLPGMRQHENATRVGILQSAKQPEGTEM
jgi:hypothetical protein